MKFFKTTKYKVTLLLIFALLIQMAGPIAADYVYADGTEFEEYIEPTEPIEPSEGAKPVDSDEELAIDGKIPEAGHEVEKPKQDNKPRLPKTGSNSNILYYAIGIVTLIAGIVLSKKNKRTN